MTVQVNNGMVIIIISSLSFLISVLLFAYGQYLYPIKIRRVRLISLISYNLSVFFVGFATVIHLPLSRLLNRPENLWLRDLIANPLWVLAILLVLAVLLMCVVMEVRLTINNELKYQ